MQQEVEGFLKEPTQDGAQSALLWLMGQTPSEAELDEPATRRLLQALARYGSLDGENLELLAEHWRTLLWEVCAEHREELRLFLESQYSGPYKDQAKALLDASIKRDDRNWLRNLQHAIHQWSEHRNQDIDLESSRKALSRALERAASNPEFTLDLRQKILLELPLDLTRGDEREFLALLWSPQGQPHILRRVAQTLQGDGSAQEREDVLCWALQHGDSQVIRHLVEVLSLDGREEVIRRFRALDRREEAAQVIVLWLELGLPTEIRRLSQSLQTFKKYWDLRRDCPDLPQRLSSALAPIFWQILAYSQELENLLQDLDSFQGLRSSLATALPKSFVNQFVENTVSEITEADPLTLVFRLFLAPLSDKAALLQIGEWHRDFPQVPVRLWSESLRERVLVFPEELQDLVDQALPEGSQFFYQIYQQCLDLRLASHADWHQSQTDQLRQQAERYWLRLGELAESLSEAWKGAPALLSRLSQLRESIATVPAPEDLCPSLQEEPPPAPSLPQGLSRAELPDLGYVLEHWSSWTTLNPPAADEIAYWMTQQSKDDLCELAFSQVTQVLESSCPESAVSALRAFLDLLAQSRPDVDQELRRQAGDALALLPFPWGGDSTATHNSIDYAGWLRQLALCLQALAKLRQRQEQEIHCSQQELRRLAARRLGPATDNLEQFLLPYFTFRQGLEDQAGLFSAVSGLNQPVRPDALGTHVQVAGSDGDDQPLRSNTLGIRLVDEERAVWPAYASPRPRQ